MAAGLTAGRLGGQLVRDLSFALLADEDRFRVLALARWGGGGVAGAGAHKKDFIGSRGRGAEEGGFCAVEQMGVRAEGELNAA